MVGLAWVAAQSALRVCSIKRSIAWEWQPPHIRPPPGKGAPLTTDETPRTAQHPNSTGRSQERPTFDTSVAHIARVYDYWLGGKDNYAADRQAGDAALEAYPYIAAGVWANRAYLARVVRYLAGEAGIRQFLDIGTGIPTGTTPMRSLRPLRLTPASFTSTTIRSCLPMRVPC
jgi:hypothetical protein